MQGINAIRGMLGSASRVFMPQNLSSSKHLADSPLPRIFVKCRCNENSRISVQKVSFTSNIQVKLMGRLSSFSQKPAIFQIGDIVWQDYPIPHPMWNTLQLRRSGRAMCFSDITKSTPAAHIRTIACVVESRAQITKTFRFRCFICCCCGYFFRLSSVLLHRYIGHWYIFIIIIIILSYQEATDTVYVCACIR